MHAVCGVCTACAVCVVRVACLWTRSLACVCAIICVCVCVQGLKAPLILIYRRNLMWTQSEKACMMPFTKQIPTFSVTLNMKCSLPQDFHHCCHNTHAVQSFCHPHHIQVRRSLRAKETSRRKFTHVGLDVAPIGYRVGLVPNRRFCTMTKETQPQVCAKIHTPWESHGEDESVRSERLMFNSASNQPKISCGHNC